MAEPISGASPTRGPWGFWATLGLSAVIAGAFLVSQIAVMVLCAIAQGLLSKDVAQYLANEGVLVGLTTIGAVPAVAGLAASFVALRKGGPDIRDYLGLGWPGGRTVALWMLALIVFLIATDSLTVALGRPIVPQVMVDMYRNTSFVPVLWIALVLAAPLSEETLFRGFLFRGLSASRLGGIGTVFVTAALWAIIHTQYDMFGVAQVLASGILVGCARLKTGSLLLCMAMHAVANLVATMEIVIFF